VSDDNRTHKATPKRVREFRKRGDIALSRDLVSAVALAGGTIALLASAAAGRTAIVDLMRRAANAADGRDVTDLPHAAVHGFLVTALPVVLTAAACGAVAILGQLGWPPSFKGPQFDLGRLSPIANLQQTFAPGAAIRRTGMALVKLAIVGVVVYAVLRGDVSTSAIEPSSLGALCWHLATRALIAVLCAMLLVGVLDYVLARRRMAAQMRMSTDEMKREHREHEGDPMIKGKRRARMRELAKRRMAANVAKADVVVVNPTHYAVALRYDERSSAAPLVVAKGVDEVAERIREVARKHGVPVLERPPLARALYKHVKEGRAIPANLYRGVAEVLAYVYRIKRRAS
jgi:flagellar biosynthetic protein FlhB